MNLLPLASTDMDAILGVIAVVVWLLSQVFSRKKNDTSTPSTPGRPEAPTDPQDELRKFFEAMEKSVNPPAEVKPVPPPPPPKIHVHAKVQRRIRVHQDEPTPPPVALPVPVVATRPELDMTESLALPVMPVATGAPLRSIYAPPVQEWQDPQALRRMIITMEVLGKPVGLRPTV